MSRGRCLAMWSGPRNLSTAMMRAWGSRHDTIVTDEPFYPHYLKATGIDHPMAGQIIAHGNTDWLSVIDTLCRPPESGVFYQKHITTHWMPYFGTDWLAKLDHVFLIRDPVRVVASYEALRDSASAKDLGYEQQAWLFDRIVNMKGQVPPVIDSTLFLANPESQLRKLCATLSLKFQSAMLSWPPGGRDTDGIWEKHWYSSVKRSTGFAVTEPPTIREPASTRTPEPEQTAATLAFAMSAHQESLVAECLPHYERLKALAIGNDH